MNSRALAGMCCLLSLPALAQQVQLPRASPSAKVMQTVGLTDITVEYSSPSVKGRKIWGGLVPYGEVWRAGANQATKVTFSKDVTVGDTAVPAGSYAFFALPGATQWTLILNKDADQFGAFSHKKESDVVHVVATPRETPLREHLAYQITDFTDDTAALTLEWEKLQVSLPIKLQTRNQVKANIQGISSTDSQSFTSAARYLLESAKDYPQGLQLVNKSLALKETWLADWTKAQLLAATGKYREARGLAEKAQQLGNKTPDDFFAAENVKTALKDWKSKS